MNGFMFDTNIFNSILDKKIEIGQQFENFNYYITHIQFCELNATPIEDRKNELLKVVEQIKNKEILTESGTVGVSKVGRCKVNDVSLYSKLLSKLQELDKSSGKNKNWKNQARDVLIAETCIKII